MGKCKQILTHFALETTITGFAQIVVFKNILAKLFWVSVLLGTVAVTMYQCVTAILYYDTNPTVVNIQVCCIKSEKYRRNLLSRV